MTRIAIAAVLALSVPAVGLADDRREHDRAARHDDRRHDDRRFDDRRFDDHRFDGWYGPPAYQGQARLDDRRDLVRLQVLLARYEQVTSRRGAVGAQRQVEREILAALDDELLESRRELRFARGFEVRQARAELARLESIRAEFAWLSGRRAPRFVERKHELLVEATRMARRELRQDPYRGAYASSWR